MADIVSIMACSHTPVMLNFPDAVPQPEREEIFGHSHRLGQAIATAKPQALVVVCDDHVHNFFLNNLPAFCIGAAPTYKSPVEHWLKADKRVLPGDAQLGAYLLNAVMASGFDPALSMELTLDHGVLTPLVLAHVSGQLPIVPILVNCVQPPLPSMKRCFDFGVALGDAIRAYPGLDRIAILASGGLSHDLSTPRMGMVNDEFDREFLRCLEAGDSTEAIRFASQHVHEAGNGAEQCECGSWPLALLEQRRSRLTFIALYPVGTPVLAWVSGGVKWLRPGQRWSLEVASLG